MKKSFKHSTPASRLLDEIMTDPTATVDPRQILLAILGYDGQWKKADKEITFRLTKMATEEQYYIFESILRDYSAEDIDSDDDDIADDEDVTDEGTDNENPDYDDMFDDDLDDELADEITITHIPEDDELCPEYLTPYNATKETLKSITMDNFKSRLNVLLNEGRFTISRVWAVYRIAQHFRDKKIKKIAIGVGVATLALVAGAIILGCIRASNNDSDYTDDWDDDLDVEEWPDWEDYLFIEEEAPVIVNETVDVWSFDEYID